ncbi:hypothetical protein ABZ490_29480 [Streptomyces sp. NPDC005811]|uniref:hypothetical protein n=1 Tax=Streptomyces sp. NPDC005811 TaxID=3154565 RepID=UPI0033C0FB4C
MKLQVFKMMVVVGAAFAAVLGHAAQDGLSSDGGGGTVTAADVLQTTSAGQIDWP